MHQPGLLRILDANANRATEALRVLEDYARFVLDDAHLTHGFKTERHNLQHILNNSVSGQREQYRDSSADVGTRISVEHEYARSDGKSVVRAASARLTESLRCIEEYGKTIERAFAEHIEQLRYRSYQLCARLMAYCKEKRFVDIDLYVLISEQHCAQPWLETARIVLEAGAGAIQLRESDLTDRELLHRAASLRDLTIEHASLLIINNRVDIALASHADGVHLGADDLSVQEARRLAGSNLIIGTTCHSVAEVEQALEHFPDYLAVGPMFPSPTKPDLPVAGPELLENIRQLTALPLVAIGGICAVNVSALLAADTLAVCSAITAAADPASITTKLCSLFKEARQTLATPGLS